MSSRPQRRPADRQRFVADASTLSALHLTLDDLADADTRALESPGFVPASPSQIRCRRSESPVSTPT